MNFYVIAFSLVISFVVFNGILMLVAPERHRRFLLWMGGRGVTRLGTESRLQIERRLAGLAMAAMGIYVMWLVWKG